MLIYLQKKNNVYFFLIHFLKSFSWKHEEYIFFKVNQFVQQDSMSLLKKIIERTFYLKFFNCCSTNQLAYLDKSYNTH